MIAHAVVWEVMMQFPSRKTGFEPRLVFSSIRNL